MPRGLSVLERATQIKHLFKWGALYQVRNGRFCKFWQDCWVGKVPLSIAYHDIFKMVSDPNCYVSECWDEGSWEMDFKRSLSIQEYNSWLDLKDKLQLIILEPEHNDSVSWALERKGQYTTKSLYRFLTDRGVGLLNLSGNASCR